MQRFHEISLLYDHSQIPIFLAQNSSTFELLALQRIPISSFITSSSPSTVDCNNNNSNENEQSIINMRAAVGVFPFIESWSKIPRHPNLLTLREVILEENQLFLISERYNETLVRFLRRNGVLNRLQIRNHAMNTDGDEKHDRAAAALVARWQSEDVLPDDEDDDFCEAIGITSDLTSFNNVSFGAGDRKRSRAYSMQADGDERRDSSMDNNNRRRSSTLVNLVSPKTHHQKEQKNLATHHQDVVSVSSSSGEISSVGNNKKKHNKNKKPRKASVQFLPSALKAQRKKNQAEDGTSGAFIFQNSLNFSGGPPKSSTSPHALDHEGGNLLMSGSVGSGGAFVNTTSGAFDDDDYAEEGGNEKSDDDISEDERDRRMLFNAAKAAERGANYDLIPDHDLAVRYCDVYRVPLTDEEIRVILFQILSALEKLHADGFAHGSICPKHLVFASRNDLTSLKLTCFRKLTDLNRIAEISNVMMNNNDNIKEEFLAFDLKTLISRAIKNSLAVIAEEEEWRKRRRSFASGGGGNNNSNSTSNSSPLSTSLQQFARFDIRNTNNNNISTGLLSNTTNTSSNAHHENSRSIKFTLPPSVVPGTPVNQNNNDELVSILKNVASTSKQFFMGPDVVQQWENEDEEILNNCSIIKNNQQQSSYQIPNSRYYEREDVKAWMTVTHAPPEVILGYSPKMIHQQGKNETEHEGETATMMMKKNNKRAAAEQIAMPPGDIWSTAVTILELYAARPLVYGDNPRDVFFRAASQFCGCPSHVADPDFHRWAMHATNAALPTGGINAVPLGSVVPMATTNKKVLDLLSRMLRLDPSERITASEALKHPFFSLDDDEEAGEDSDDDGYY